LVANLLIEHLVVDENTRLFYFIEEDKLKETLLTVAPNISFKQISMVSK